MKLKSVKHSVEFVHNKFEDMNKAYECTVQIDKKTQERLVELEATNTNILNSVIDLKARSMRNNLIFYNIDEKEGENTTSLIHNILEEHLGIENASMNVKIDHSPCGQLWLNLITTNIGSRRGLVERSLRGQKLLFLCNLLKKSRELERAFTITEEGKGTRKK